METKYINLIPERETPVFHFSEGDNNRIIRCKLYDGAKAVTLTGSEIIRMRYKKPDGSISSVSISNTSGNYVDIEIPDTITNIKGKTYCKIRINNIGAKAFIIDTEAKP